MKIEDQVCSLELAKRLKEFDVNQESLFIWVLNKDDHPKAGWSIFANSPYVKNNLRFEDQCSAFTCSELGLMLPRKKFIQSATESDNHLQITKNIDGYFIAGYVNHDNGQLHHITISENEANTRAALLVFLLENQLMELPE